MCIVHSWLAHATVWQGGHHLTEMPLAIIRRAKNFGHVVVYYGVKFLLPGRNFSFKGQRYSYFYHRYNNTCETERGIEIPIAFEFLRKRPKGSVLEVGNVLNHYAPFDHTIVDKYEQSPHVINADIADIQLPERFATIISVSTMEHVGWDEDAVEPDKVILSIKRLQAMLIPGGAMLITFPIGHHPMLDEAIKDGTLGCTELTGMKRLNVRNDWQEVSVKELVLCRLSHPYTRRYPSARRVRGVAFAYFCN